MASPNGGIAAPGRARGRGRAGGAGLQAPRTGRGRAVNPQGRGMMNPPGQGPLRPKPAARPGGGGALGGQGLAGPGGRQLEARVKSGAITGAQAQKTMQQRQTLAKALGPNWRDKLQVGGKSFAQVNAGLKKNPGNAKLAALRKKLVTNRSSVLEDARKPAKKKAAKGGGIPGAGE